MGSLVVGGLMFAAASPASATLGTCHTSFSNNDDRGLYQVHCDGSPPQEYRAWIKCTNGHEYDGPWYQAGSGSISSAQCPVNTFYTSYGFDVY